jgi:hypothetical protein
MKLTLGALIGAAALALLVYETRLDRSHRGGRVAAPGGEPSEPDERDPHRTNAPSDEPSLPRATNDDPSHAVPTLDRVRADRMREQIRALLAEAGPLALLASRPPPPGPAAPDASFATMPVLAGGDAEGPRIDPDYIKKRVHEDLFPLAKGCYADALKRDPKAAGKLVVFFRIIGDQKVGGVVDETKLLDGTTLADPEMQTCVRESMMSVSFDAPPGDREVTVVYPIDFSPEDDDASAVP